MLLQFLRRNIRNRTLIFFLLLIGLLSVALLSLSVGPVVIEPFQVLAMFGDVLGFDHQTAYSRQQQTVLLSIRAPRVVLGLLIGATLATSGAAIQGLFRNALADPALIGIASGAAMAAAVAIVLEPGLPESVRSLFGLYYLPLAAFTGGFIVTWIVYRIASRSGKVDIASLLLAGIAINALTGSVTGLMTYVADDVQIRTLTFWSMGSLSGANWSQLMTGAPFFIVTLLTLPLLSRALNALLLGEAEARHLGFAIERIKIGVILLVALGVGASVALSGMIGFIGLVVPHLIRLCLGPDHRGVLIGSALLGALLLLSSDFIAKTVAIPAEVPIGIITGLLGSPFFLWLLRRQRILGA